MFDIPLNIRFLALFFLSNISNPSDICLFSAFKTPISAFNNLFSARIPSSLPTNLLCKSSIFESNSLLIFNISIFRQKTVHTDGSLCRNE
uniref:Putative secreted protein n=1 Tax=Panstrongylus lignarius TaxID=156445 RepID=A0A224XYX2_9HEMI